jgi:gliding motility-associated-like protein
MIKPQWILMKQRIRKSCLLFFIFLSANIFASHIVGGDFYYQCLGNNQYKITLMVYRDCNGIALRTSNSIMIYNSAGALLQTLTIPLGTVTNLPSNAPNPCTTPPAGICIEVGEYSATVTLPPIPGGYQLATTDCCRNAGIINGPANDGSYTTNIPDVTKVTCNSSAHFKNWPPIFICAGLPFNFDHSATDPDGDALTYSLCTPLEGANFPFTPYPFTAPYTAANPMGGGLAINATTGQLTGTPSTIGQYVVGICVTETRNGVVVNSSIRDFQFNVVPCNIVSLASAIGAVTNCNTHEVTFFNTSIGGVSYLWRFGDGTTSTTFAPVHTYPALGTYTVTLIAYASNNTCNDSTKITVKVDICRPCGMTVAPTSTPADCGVGGCGKLVWTIPCSQCASLSVTACNPSGLSTGGSCGSSNVSTGCPYSIKCGANDVSKIPGATLVFTPGSCTCSMSTSSSGSNVVVSLCGNKPITLGTASVNITGGTAPYNVQWSTTPAQSGTGVSGLNIGSYTAIVTDANGCVEVKNVNVAGNGGITLTTNKTNITTCGANNGTASVTPAGGSGTYTYSWSPGGQTTSSISGLAPGTYEVKVNDASGCPSISTVTIAPATTITASVTPTNVSCATSVNGSALASASGGVGPYVYTWNTSPQFIGNPATGLSKGFYQVTATDANGCTGTYAFTLSSPPALTLAMSKTAPSCFKGTNGSATVTVTGGTGTKNYQWSANASGQVTATITNIKGSQTYVVTVTDGNGCTATGAIVVTEPGIINHDVVDQSTMTCAGVFTGKAQVVASGGTAPLKYSWSCTAATTASVSGLPVGACTVKVTDANGCTAQDVVTLKNSGVLTVTATSTKTCGSTNTGTATVNPLGGILPYTYTWSCNGSKSQAITGLAAGTACTATVTDKGGCVANVSVTIAGAPALVLATAPSPGCTANSSTIDLTVTGGSSPYIYTWGTGPTSEDLSGLASNQSYKVTVWDANNCLDSLTTFIPVPNCNPSVTVAGGSVCVSACKTLTAAGTLGKPPYTYAWGPSGSLNTSAGTTVSACPAVATTYTVTITDNNGATGTSIAQVDFYPTTTLNTSKTDVSCNGGTDGTATALPSAGTAPYSYSWSTVPSQTSATASGLPMGTYNVTSTDAHGCTQTTSATISEPTVITLTPNVTDATCGNNNGSATVTGSGGTGTLTYVWSGGITGQTISAVGAGSYAIVVLDSKGCTKTTVVPISNTPAPTISSITGTPTLCNGGSDGTASVVANGGTGALTYSWSNGSSGVTAVTGLSAITYVVTVTDAVGCARVSTVVITEPTVIVPNTVPVSSTCGKPNGSAGVIPTGGTGGFSFLWSTGGTAQTVTGLTATILYTVTVADAAGCTKSATVTVQDIPGGTVTASIVANVKCNGGSDGSVTANVAGGTPGYSYLWSTGTSTQIQSNLTQGPYTVTATDANGCTTTSSITVTEPSPITAPTFTTVDASCGVSNGSATATATGGTGTLKYNWSSGSSNATAGNLLAGSYVVTVMDANGCTKTGTVTVSNIGGPVLSSITPTNLKCNAATNGSAVLVISSGTGPYSYSWSSGVSDVTNDTQSSISNVKAGIYIVTVNDAKNCQLITSVTVTEPTAIVITTTTTVAACGQNNGTAKATVLGGTGSYTYLWNDGQALDSAINMAVAIYTITVTDANGCFSTAAANVVNANAPTAITSVPIPVPCKGGTGVAGVITSGGTVPYSYSWSTGATSLTSNTQSFTSNIVAGIYTVTITDIKNCIVISTVTLTEPDSLLVTASNTLSECGKFNGSATALANGGTTVYTYRWSNTTTGPGITNLGPGTYFVTVTDQNGCTITDSTTVRDTSILITYNVAPRVGVVEGESLPITISGALSYTWSPTTGLTCNNAACSTVTIAPATTTTYTIFSVDSYGCTAISMLTVEVRPPCTGSPKDLFIANIFSPNNDGLNDILYIEGSGLAHVYWSIYDRWGNQLFESVNQSYGWDGTKNGNPVESGTYVYYLKATCIKTNTEMRLKGNVTIVR